MRHTKQLTVDTVVVIFSVLFQKAWQKWFKTAGVELGLQFKATQFIAMGSSWSHYFLSLEAQRDECICSTPSSFLLPLGPRPWMVLPLSEWVLSLQLNLLGNFFTDTPGCISMVIVNAIKISHLRYYHMHYHPHLDIKFTNEKGQTCKACCMILPLWNVWNKPIHLTAGGMIVNLA